MQIAIWGALDGLVGSYVGWGLTVVTATAKAIAYVLVACLLHFILHLAFATIYHFM